ncbi:ABC transporter ATP-binding protein [Clostridium sp.]|uniref:ABC transporter ATP-binding protein n=1 Tax=Clostridium sp. TaxID=1506 RepID=UPI001A5463EA|nr:energy-coupling factor transporter ATPase [Clostridium sp.]MBK5239889.1 ABC transporter ATP-binding protein [Clostridium sp.]
MEVKKVLDIKNLSFTYPLAKKKAINNLNFEINKGEFVLMCGSSGSGKTTLAKCLNGIIPHLANGNIEGDVIVNGKNTQDVKMHEISSEIGMVFQNPEDQIFSIRVDDEVAFGVECQGYKRDEIVKRVKYALKKLRIEDISRHLTFSLSGGQKQKVSIASNLAMLPSIIILDDPTTDLDPISKQEVMDILQELKNEVDVTFIVIEHDLTDLLEFADRVIVMHDGEIILNGKPDQIFYEQFLLLDKIGVRIPDHIRLGKYLIEQGIISAKDGYPIKKETLKKLTRKAILNRSLIIPDIKYKDYTIKSTEKVAEIKHVNFTYPEAKKQTLFDVNFDIYKGEFFGIVGHNGSGKSTIMKNILGLLKPTSGDVFINGKNTKDIDISKLILDIGYVFQNPDNQLFCNTVREEIEFGLRDKNLPEDVIRKEADKALDIVELKAKENDHPFSLSRGQRQRLAVATMLVANPKIIMLDEPTTGLDEKNLASLLKLMQEIIYNFGGTLIMVTHDMEVVAKYATRVIVVNHGNVVLNGNPDEIFGNHYNELDDLKLKPTIIASMSSELKDVSMPFIPNWDIFEKQVVNNNNSNEDNAKYISSVI